MIDLPRIVRRVTSWWLARRLERRMPELASLRKAEAEARRNHRTVKGIHLSRRAIVHRRLAEETPRGANRV